MQHGQGVSNGSSSLYPFSLWLASLLSDLRLSPAGWQEQKFSHQVTATNAFPLHINTRTRLRHFRPAEAFPALTNPTHISDQVALIIFCVWDCTCVFSDLSAYFYSGQVIATTQCISYITAKHHGLPLSRVHKSTPCFRLEQYTLGKYHL